ncbi:Transmembrane and coiled-coil domains protein 1 [Zootermopsis nevadensis]|uniref:Transmembrane and coiled-coil domains protein 1 n=1 Tax=Zootermopsis nevadensis TaxID=136037 RepID=A0A067RIG5_ZOONE|nr:Transmembrane and coiled-coil domains protein 1 [Zootermopsis nevadensis]
MYMPSGEVEALRWADPSSKESYQLSIDQSQQRLGPADAQGTEERCKRGDSLDKQDKKKIEREEEKLKNNNRDLSLVKMKSMFTTGFTFTALLSIFDNIQKMLGFAPSRTASKQSGSIFGPPPQQFK